MNWPIALVFFVLFDLLLLGYVLYKRSRRKFSVADRSYFLEQWSRIADGHDIRHAVMDADKLLNVVLRKMGYQGGVGDQLKKAQKLFSDLNGVWSAHKLRNRMAHELELSFVSREGGRALKQFERALRDLGAL